MSSANIWLPFSDTAVWLGRASMRTAPPFETATSPGFATTGRGRVTADMKATSESASALPRRMRVLLMVRLLSG